ncbi:hypothetical protein GCM10018987_43920 [Streptomyces cremeus]
MRDTGGSSNWVLAPGGSRSVKKTTGDPSPGSRGTGNGIDSSEAGAKSRSAGGVKDKCRYRGIKRVAGFGRYPG